MYNGKISGNDGGVKNSKLFSMYGGTITANTSTKKVEEYIIVVQAKSLCSEAK